MKDINLTSILVGLVIGFDSDKIENYGNEKPSLQMGSKRTSLVLKGIT